MSDFLLGAFLMALICLGFGAIVTLSVTGYNEAKQELIACRAKDGVLVAEVHGGYACINTSALYTWQQQ